MTARERAGAFGRVYALSVVLAGTAGVLASHRLVGLEPPEGGTIPWVALLVAFALTEMFPVHLEHRREAITLSLSTIPLVVGLFTVTPLMLITARVLGAGLVFVLHRRQRPYKLALNLTMFALDGAVAAVVFHALMPAGGIGLRAWPAAFAAALSADLVSTVVLVMAISLFQRKIEPGVLPSALVGTGVAFVDTCAALLVVTLLVAEPAGLALLALVIAPLVAAYRLYSSLREQHGHLGKLHELTSEMGGALHADAVLPTLLERAQELMHAESAWVRLPGEDGGDIDEARLLADARGMAAPLIGPSGPLGVLYVGERSGDVRPFVAEDLRLFETLANHASVSLGNSRLVEQLREQAATSNHQSMHDALTGLPNRLLFHDRLDDRLRAPGITAILLLDLDRFKEVNDTLGHPIGDVLLCEVGERLRTALREGDLVARLGGDEFAVLLPDVASAAAAVQVALGLVRALEQRFEIDDVTVSIGASIGVAVSPDHGDTASKLLQLADVAMYTAKAEQSGV
ncbi:MAG: diguanylate cyclase domain-containing protein, partial [Microthrixaceae bacterium]